MAERPGGLVVDCVAGVLLDAFALCCSRLPLCDSARYSGCHRLRARIARLTSTCAVGVLGEIQQVPENLVAPTRWLLLFRFALKARGRCGMRARRSRPPASCRETRSHLVSSDHLVRLQPVMPHSQNWRTAFRRLNACLRPLLQQPTRRGRAVPPLLWNALPQLAQFSVLRKRCHQFGPHLSPCCSTAVSGSDVTEVASLDHVQGGRFRRLTLDPA